MRWVWVIVVVVVVGIAFFLFTRKAEPPAAPDASAGPGFRLTSPAFAEGEAIPARYTCNGRNVSPPLSWENPPEGTVSFALLVDDPDAPGLGAFIHWMIADLSAGLRELPEDVPQGANISSPVAATQGDNGFDEAGYGGPCPPPGDEAHGYVFTLYALDTTLDIPGPFTRQQFRAAMRGHVLGTAKLTGTYAR